MKGKTKMSTGNENIMSLTKEKAIEEHRKMWNWIADRYEDHVNAPLVLLERIYASINQIPLLRYEKLSFCCDYDEKIRIIKGNNDKNTIPGCLNCPLKWGTEDKHKEMFGAYYYCDRDPEERKTMDAPYGVFIYDMTHKYSPEEKYFLEIPYSKFTHDCISDEEYERLSNLARQIANLPEKK